MTQVLIGKLLPNLKITLGNEADTDDNVEEGEITDILDTSDNNEPTNEVNKKSVEIVRTWMETLQNPKVYENKSGAFITGLDLSSEVLIKKLEERASRFGLEKRGENQITQNEIDALYKSLGTDPENSSSCKSKNIRLDAIHMRGVEEMSTNEIFQYFVEYGPSSVEWINDVTCNVVWLDKTSCARALLGVSRPLVVRRKGDKKNTPTTNTDISSLGNEAVIEMSDESEDEESKPSVLNSENAALETDSMDVDEQMDNSSSEDDDVVKDASNVDIPVPPGHWRLGVPHPKAKAILLRFANKDDKKLPGAEKRSQYYQKYGNPNYGGLKGLISTSRKRKIQAAKNRQVIEKLEDPKLSDDISSGLIPSSKSRKRHRMRMYADDEEEKKSRAIANSSDSGSKRRSIHSRLGTKYTKDDLYHLGNKLPSSDEEDSETAPKTRVVSSRFNIWSGVLAEDMAEENKRKESYQFNRSSQDLRNRVFRDLRSSSSQDLNSRYSQDLRNRSSQDLGLKDRTSRNFLNRSSQDLRHTLRSSLYKRSNVSPSRGQEDLRSKIKGLRKDDEFSKHRSPLCLED